MKKYKNPITIFALGILLFTNCKKKEVIAFATDKTSCLAGEPITLKNKSAERLTGTFSRECKWSWSCQNAKISHDYECRYYPSLYLTPTILEFKLEGFRGNGNKIGTSTNTVVVLPRPSFNNRIVSNGYTWNEFLQEWQFNNSETNTPRTYEQVSTSVVNDKLEVTCSTYHPGTSGIGSCWTCPGGQPAYTETKVIRFNSSVSPPNAGIYIIKPNGTASNEINMWNEGNGQLKVDFIYGIAHITYTAINTSGISTLTANGDIYIP